MNLKVVGDMVIMIMMILITIITKVREDRVGVVIGRLLMINQDYFQVSKILIPLN